MILHSFQPRTRSSSSSHLANSIESRLLHKMGLLFIRWAIVASTAVDWDEPVACVCMCPVGGQWIASSFYECMHCVANNAKIAKIWVVSETNVGDIWDRKCSHSERMDWICLKEQCLLPRNSTYSIPSIPSEVWHICEHGISRKVACPFIHRKSSCCSWESHVHPIQLLAYCLTRYAHWHECSVTCKREGYMMASPNDIY